VGGGTTWRWSEVTAERVEERVLVIEGSAAVRRETSARLGAAGFSVLAEADGSELEKTVSVYEPDLVVLEANGRRLDDVVHAIRADSRLPVIILLGDDAVRRRLEAFQAGVDDVLVKPFSVEELVARVSAVLERSGRRRNVIRVADVVVDEAAHVAMRAGVPLDLTGTEFSLLAALTRNCGLVMSKRVLLAKVWGFEYYHVNVVEVHVCALRRKLEAQGPRLIHTVRGVGYVLRLPSGLGVTTPQMATGT
jgi:two-component system, OmpR family, response regulator